VVVAPNLPGDIISDNGATTAGGFGLASAETSATSMPCLNRFTAARRSTRQRQSESACGDPVCPDDAGLARNAPRRCAFDRAAEKVEDAVAELLSEGKTLTYDLIGEEKASRCSEVVALWKKKLRKTRP
jgi:3-isopropylmalate dehydrogenase